MQRIWVGRDRWARRVQRGGPSGPALPANRLLDVICALEKDRVREVEIPRTHFAVRNMRANNTLLSVSGGGRRAVVAGPIRRARRPALQFNPPRHSRREST